jgi:TATA-box binding protein (TBP) (component of TFIID and TFIIIB)
MSRASTLSAAHAASRNGDCAQPQNVVATFQLGCPIDLVPLAVAIGGRAEPSVFPAMVSHSTDTATSNSVFATGRTVEVGCKSEDHALLAAHMLAAKIYELTGQLCGVYNFEVCNTVCRVELPYSLPPQKDKNDTDLPPSGGINMTMLLSDIKVAPNTALVNGFKYEPDKFPGLKWKVELPGFPGEYVTFAWFVRGRGVATGLKDPSRVRACNEIINAMPSYERGCEYREMTEAEKELDAQSALVRAAKAPTKKTRKRQHALSQQQT